MADSEDARRRTAGFKPYTAADSARRIEDAARTLGDRARSSGAPVEGHLGSIASRWIIQSEPDAEVKDAFLAFLTSFNRAPLEVDLAETVDVESIARSIADQLPGFCGEDDLASIKQELLSKIESAIRATRTNRAAAGMIKLTKDSQGKAYAKNLEKFFYKRDDNQSRRLSPADRCVTEPNVLDWVSRVKPGPSSKYIPDADALQEFDLFIVDEVARRRTPDSAGRSTSFEDIFAGIADDLSARHPDREIPDSFVKSRYYAARNSR